MAFGGKLKQIPVFRYPNQIDRGETLPLFEGVDDYFRITIAKSAAETPVMYAALLLHEMIHQLQCEQGLEVDHDEFFEETARQIYALTGIDLL